MAERYIADPKTQVLIQSGLTPHQAALYECLARRGEQTASRASFLAGVPRTLGYKVLSELQGLGLVSKREVPGKVARFGAAHPLKLKELAERRLNDAKEATLALDSSLATLISDFNTVADAPGVRILEGVEGYKELLADQISENKAINKIISPNHTKFKELADMTEAHYTRVKALGIPLVLATHPAITTDVALYGDKIALTTYKDTPITLIVENAAINKTLWILFEYMWSVATK